MKKGRLVLNIAVDFEYPSKKTGNARMHNDGYPSACVNDLNNNVLREVCLRRILVVNLSEIPTR